MKERHSPFSWNLLKKLVDKNKGITKCRCSEVTNWWFGLFKSSHLIQGLIFLQPFGWNVIKSKKGFSFDLCDWEIYLCKFNFHQKFSCISSGTFEVRKWLKKIFFSIVRCYEIVYIIEINRVIYIGKSGPWLSPFSSG